MFLRIKKVKGKDYCYLVENRWEHGRTRQAVREYLGRVVSTEAVMGNFFGFYAVDDVALFLKKKNKKEIVIELIGWELSAARFSRLGAVLSDGDVHVDCETKKITCKEKQVVLRVNEGYLCDYTLRKILDFQRSGNIEKDSVALARAFVDAGLRIPKEMFIGFFEKI